MTRTGRVRRFAAAIIVALAALLFVSPVPAHWVEQGYSATRYLTLQRVLTTAANRVGIAWFDVLIVAIVALLVWRWTRRLRGTPRPGERSGERSGEGSGEGSGERSSERSSGRAGRRSGGRWRAIGLGCVDTLVIACALYIWFVLVWGLNYRRLPLETRLDFERARVTQASVAESARRAVTELNRLHPIAASQPWPSLDALTDTLDGPFAEAQRALGQSGAARGGRPKATLLGPYFRWAAIDGMTDPFFLETLVNQEALPVERPFIVAHEWGHLAGYAREAEANYLGWLICQAGPPQAQYSAWLALYWHLIGALPMEQRRALDAQLHEGPRGDLRAIAARYYKSAPRVRVTAWAVYDRFLKANRVAEGVASYDGVVTLLVGTRYRGVWEPLLREAPSVSRD